MKKGLVTKIQSNYMLVLTDQMTIEKVKPKPLVNIGQRLEYAKSDIYKGVKIFDFKKFSSILSIFLMLILSSYYFIDSSNATEVYAVVSIDINPSIELLVDKNNLVIDYRAYNEDGKNVLDKSIKNIRVEEAISRVIINAQNSDYLVGRDMILISSSIVSDNSIVDSLNLNDHLKMFMRNNQEKYQFVYIQGSSRNDKGQSIGMQALKDMSTNPSKDEFDNLEALVNDVVLKESMDDEKPIEIIKGEDGKVLVDSFTLTDEKFKMPKINKIDKNKGTEDVISDSDENQHNVNLLNDNKEEVNKNDSKEDDFKKNESKEEDSKKNDSKEDQKNNGTKEEDSKVNESKEEIKKDDSKEEDSKKNDSKEDQKNNGAKEEDSKVNDSKEDQKNNGSKEEDSKVNDSTEDQKNNGSKEEDSKVNDSKEDQKNNGSKEEDSKKNDSTEDQKNNGSKEEDSKVNDSKEDQKNNGSNGSKEEDSTMNDLIEEKKDDSKEELEKDDSKHDNEENENMEEKKNIKVEKEKP